MAHLLKSVSGEFERLRFLRRGGDLASGGFRWWGRPLLGVVLLLGGSRWDSAIDLRGGCALVIGGAEKLNSADAPEIERLSAPEGV